MPLVLLVVLLLLQSLHCDAQVQCVLSASDRAVGCAAAPAAAISADAADFAAGFAAAAAVSVVSADDDIVFCCLPSGNEAAAASSVHGDGECLLSTTGIYLLPLSFFHLFQMVDYICCLCLWLLLVFIVPFSSPMVYFCELFFVRVFWSVVSFYL